jgi:hypothetical protein
MRREGLSPHHRPLDGHPSLVPTPVPPVAEATLVTMSSWQWVVVRLIHDSREAHRHVFCSPFSFLTSCSGGGLTTKWCTKEEAYSSLVVLANRRVRHT